MARSTSHKEELEMINQSKNVTNSAYEIASWTAVFYVGDKIAAAINIERLREIVSAADSDWALLVAKEGGAA